MPQGEVSLKIGILEPIRGKPQVSKQKSDAKEVFLRKRLRSEDKKGKFTNERTDVRQS
jgi:hypothetical protein